LASPFELNFEASDYTSSLGNLSNNFISQISNGTHAHVDLESLKHHRRFALVQHHLFGACLGRGWVQPFLGQARCQHHRASVVNVHHAARAIGGDDHEAVMFARVVIVIWSLGA
jgi:hypothetical protein